MPILRSIQYVTFKYGDFQKASRLSLREPSISINSIIVGQLHEEYREESKYAIISCTRTSYFLKGTFNFDGGIYTLKGYSLRR